MKVKNLKTVFAIVAVLFSFAASSQSIVFEYDMAGNRLSRASIYLRTSEVDSNNSKQGEVFKDLLGENKITISPNPNGGRFTVKIEGFDLENPPQIFLHSISGVMIYENHKATILSEIDISNRENGTYILSLIIGTERKTWKIIKQ